MAFTAMDVKALREKTGVGMMECKKALTEADGDMDKAIDFLRERGLAAAEKKSARIAAEGVVYTYYDEAAKKAVTVEVNSETDFVAKNDKFMDFVKGVARTIIATAPADVEALCATAYDGTDRTVTETLNDLILSIGENIFAPTEFSQRGLYCIFNTSAGKSAKSGASFRLVCTQGGQQTDHALLDQIVLLQRRVNVLHSNHLHSGAHGVDQCIYGFSAAALRGGNQRFNICFFCC